MKLSQTCTSYIACKQSGKFLHCGNINIYMLVSEKLLQIYLLTLLKHLSSFTVFLYMY